MTTLTILVPGRPPTPNNGARQKHWHEAARVTAEWRNAARLVALSARPSGWKPLVRCHLAVEFILGDRARRDLDNLIAATKPLTDGLVDAGIMVDDSIAVIATATYAWTYLQGVHATRYTITGEEADTLLL